jgi:hypothetical protein
VNVITAPQPGIQQRVGDVATDRVVLAGSDVQQTGIAPDREDGVHALDEAPQVVVRAPKAGIR